MNQETLYGQTIEWMAPDGNVYTLREQNGADDDILSNSSKARDLSNLLEFISAIVVKVNGESKKLSLDNVLSLPINVKYGLLIKSRIFSLGEELEFEYTWPEEESPITYTLDLNQFLFNDYSVIPGTEELLEKEDAVPYYPEGNIVKDLTYTTSTGKQLMFDRFDGHAEKMILKSMDKGTTSQNTPLQARNLRIFMNGEWMKVSSFHIFTAREMNEIRKEVYAVDPVFSGEFTIEHPHKKELTDKITLFGIADFFFPGQA